MTINGQESTATLDKVLLIPTLTTNLISVGAATKNKILAEFDENKCKFTKKGLTIMEGNKISEQLYLLNIRAKANQAYNIDTNGSIEPYRNGTASLATQTSGESTRPSNKAMSNLSTTNQVDALTAPWEKEGARVTQQRTAHAPTNQVK